MINVWSTYDQRMINIWSTYDQRCIQVFWSQTRPEFGVRLGEWNPLHSWCIEWWHIVVVFSVWHKTNQIISPRFMSFLQLIPGPPWGWWIGLQPSMDIRFILFILNMYIWLHNLLSYDVCILLYYVICVQQVRMACLTRRSCCEPNYAWNYLYLFYKIVGYAAHI